MNREALQEIIRQDLPELLRVDPEFRSCILEITRDTYADQKETQNWFHEMLNEMRRERERQDEKWEAHERQHKEEFDRVHEEIMAMAKKHDRSIGALGAKWGMQSERFFRNALAGILEKNCRARNWNGCSV